MKEVLLLDNRDRRFEHCVGIERDAVDPLLDEELRELGVVARGLAADADLAPVRAAVAITCAIIVFTAGISLVEDVRDDLRVAIDAQDELRQVVRADREAVEDLGEFARPGSRCWESRT